MILDESSYKDLPKERRILFIGDGTEKFKNLYSGNNVKWLGPGMAHAKYMVTLAEKKYRENKFSDVAYSVPNYLKAYQATQPKDKLKQ